MTDETYRVTADELRQFVERIDAPKICDLLSLMEGTECWRPVSGNEDYHISSWGRVKGKRVEFLRTHLSHGYHVVSLSDGTSAKTARVATMVLEAFIGPRPFPEAQAAHGDGDKGNNRLSNLRWATALENQADVDRHGNRCKGSNVCGSVLTEADIPRIRDRVKRGERYPKIASDFGVSISTISLIKNEKIWKHV